MRIINQARSVSVNLDNIELSVIEECIGYHSGDGGYRILGRYETRERAKQVFREIHEKYMGLPFDDEPNTYYMPED